MWVAWTDWHRLLSKIHKLVEQSGSNGYEIFSDSIICKIKYKKLLWRLLFRVTGALIIMSLATHICSIWCWLLHSLKTILLCCSRNNNDNLLHFLLWEEVLWWLYIQSSPFYPLGCKEVYLSFVFFYAISYSFSPAVPFCSRKVLLPLHITIPRFTLPLVFLFFFQLNLYSHYLLWFFISTTTVKLYTSFIQLFCFPSRNCFLPISHTPNIPSS